MAPALRTMIWLISAALSAAAPASASDDQAISGPYCAKVQDAGCWAPPASRACGALQVTASSATRTSLYVLVSEHAAAENSLFNVAVAADAAGSNSGESLLRRFTRRAKPACGNVLALD
jgi:hypothetical protein